MAVQSARGAAGSLPGVGGGALQFHRFSKAKVLSPLPPPSQHLCWASVTTGSWGRRRGRALGGGGAKALTCLWTIYVDLLERVQRPAGAASEHWPPSSAHLHNLEVLYYWLFPPFSSSSISPLFAASSRKKTFLFLLQDWKETKVRQSQKGRADTRNRCPLWHHRGPISQKFVSLNAHSSMCNRGTLFQSSRHNMGSVNVSPFAVSNKWATRKRIFFFFFLSLFKWKLKRFLTLLCAKTLKTFRF